MDELLSIENCVGQIAGAIGLQFAYENETVNLEEIEKEEFKVEDKKEVKKPVLDEDGNEVPEEAPEGEDAGAPEGVPDFKVEDHEWTITNRKS